jgi:type I restriction enzyme S subunit
MPAHWSEGKLRWLARRYAGGTPDKAREDYWADGAIPWLNSGAVNQGLILEPSAFITEDALANSSARWVPAGALVLALAGQGKTKGMVAQLGFPSTCNQSMAAIVPNSELEARYLYWWLSSNYQNLRNMAGGDNRDGLNLELLGNVGCPIPPLGEQRAIATFLDRETTKIDALVEAQRRLIELLKEKRQAVISHAVTKGLDPTVPMKDSGVEWLGEVPAHWEVKRLKHLTSAITVGIVVEPSKYYVEDGVPALRSLNVKPGKLNLDNLVYISAEANEILSKSQLRAGDLVAVRTGQPGTTAIVPIELDGANCIDLIVIRRPFGSERFLCWYLASDPAVRQFSEGSGGAIQQHFNIGTAVNLLIPVAPIGEQEAIAEFLDRHTEGIDALAEKAESAMELLRERRAALISAAVTGKIDVRGLVNEHAEAA